MLLFRPFRLFFCFSLLLLFINFRIPSANAQDSPLYVVCDSTPSYTNNSTFGANLKTLLSYLSISNLVNGFYNGSVGAGKDRIYGIVQCRGDAMPDACKGCIKVASEEILSRCPNRSATIWYDSCLLRYSNTFSGSTTPVWVYMYNTQNVTDPDQFSIALGWLMNNLASKAAFDPRLFATGHTNLSTSSILYGLVQCLKDLNPSVCSKCLEGAIAQIPYSCDGKEGGRVFGAVCSTRYEIYPFYQGSDIEVTDPPAEAPRPTVALPPSFTNTSSSTNETIAGTEHNSSRIIAILVPAITAAIILFVLFAFCLLRKTSLQKKKKNTTAIDVIEVADKSFLVNFDRLRAATNDFSNENKLGEGGFGPVYKATLANGQEIAVKRLSVNSGQGVLEFRNEVALIAKLHHRNLVRLFGCCVEGEEKLLIYEYIPNRSLDYFLFDPMKSDSLNWECRYKIIGGIARGLLYLHEESQLKIIHRDLKASNILLDANMNPKISDFGMAKIFQVDQTQANTSRIAGTYGYMSPEYVTNGQFSVKSDVFSFGVLLLEIVSGQKNNTFYQTNLAEDLLSYVWRAWTNGTVLEIIDSTLSRHFPRSKAMRCIHIGLLCVQNDPTVRPNISSVVVMLNSFSTTLPAPSPPAFFISNAMEPSLQLNYSKQENGLDPLLEKSKTSSINGASITELEPR